jgi:uncharacterized membrane protein
MKPNAEIRSETKGILERGWYGRIASVLITLYLVTIVAVSLVSVLFAEMHIQTLSDHMVAKINAARQGLEYAIPSMKVGLSMTGASLFLQMVAYLFGAIFMFGLATVLLKSLRNDTNRWFADSFGGFSRPLEVLWLIVLMNIKVFLWSLLFVIPGLVAIYRYRQAWYLKSENPEWGASKCLAESGRIMKGRKWAAFCLDCSYVWVLLFCMIAVVAVNTLVEVASRLLGTVGQLISSFTGLVAVVIMALLVLRFTVRLFTARAVFYRAAAEAAQCPAES